MSSGRRALIDREITRSSKVLHGTVVSPLVQKNFDPSGYQHLTWVADVFTGSGTIMRDILVKQSGSGGRGFAQVGLSVELRMTHNGKWSIVGPADRIISTGAVSELDEDADTEASGLPRTGFSVVKQTYDYYAGDLPGTPGSGLYGSPGYPKFLQVDGDGAGKPRGGEDREGEDSHPHKESPDGCHLGPLKEGQSF